MEHSDVTRVDHEEWSRAYLVVQRGDARLEVVELPATGRITVGRATSNRVVVPDAKCSRQHCELFYRGGNWHLRDLESRNGITVDGIRVEGEQVLKPGETIGIGSCSLLLTNHHPHGANRKSGPARVETENSFEIIERKSGTQFDGPSGMQRMQSRKRGATDLFRIAREMAVTPSIDGLCKVVLDGLCLRTGATVGGILASDSREEAKSVDDLQVTAIWGDKGPEEFSSFLTKIAFDDRDAILAHDISRHSALAAQESLQKLAAESAICAPIRHARAVLGVIHLYSFQANEPLTQDDLEFVLAVADQMGDQLHSILEREKLEEGLDRARRFNSELRDQLATETELIGHGPRMDALRRSIARVAPTDALVLVRGESGVGKELVSRAVHFNSHRNDGPFVCVNCAALTESLLESELFGHEKGAFTGATARRAGKFEKADGGTLFLDEIGEMSSEIQAKFLRVLEGQPFERVGGGDPISVDVRVVTATNRDLEEAVRDGSFRRDLFFRLQVIEIYVPALREHAEDIPAIAQHFVARFAEQAHRKIRGFNSAAVEKLQNHDWPGNVRELRNVVERAVILSENEILGPDDVILSNLRLDRIDEDSRDSLEVPTETDGGAVETAIDPLVDLLGSFIQQENSLDDIDRLYIEAVLTYTNWNKSQASRLLQIERTTLDRRLKKYGITRPDDAPEDEEE